jgi:hypothetical protein
MRRVNVVISALLIVIFLLHGLMGSFMLLDVSSGAGKGLAWVGVGLLVAHIALGAFFTLRTIRARSDGGAWYLRQNSLFWARRISGLAILVLAFCHIGLFGRVVAGSGAAGSQYLLFKFTTARLITQLLLIAALFTHLLLNLRPLLVALGIIAFKERRGDLFLILSTFLLFFAFAVTFYYLAWQ